MTYTELEYVAIGRILSPWGNDGLIRVDVATDFPERFAPSSKVFIDGQPAIIEDVSWHKGKALIKLDIISNAGDSRKLQGRLLEIHRSQLQSLPDGCYYHFQLMGLEVRTTADELLGEIVNIITAADSDTYVVQGPRGEILIPAAEDIVKSIDIDKGQMVIEPIKWLLDLNKKAAR